MKWFVVSRLGRGWIDFEVLKIGAKASEDQRTRPVGIIPQMAYVRCCKHHEQTSSCPAHTTRHQLDREDERGNK